MKYSFAYGGKEDLPFPIDRKAMDKSIKILKDKIQNARMGDAEKLRLLQRFKQYVPDDYQTADSKLVKKLSSI